MENLHLKYRIHYKCYLVHQHPCFFFGSDEHTQEYLYLIAKLNELLFYWRRAFTHTCWHRNSVDSVRTTAWKSHPLNVFVWNCCRKKRFSDFSFAHFNLHLWIFKGYRYPEAYEDWRWTERWVIRSCKFISTNWCSYCISRIAPAT